MADIGTGDPNAVITDPTGGARNFDVASVFKQFGYYPTQAEINALAPAFEGRTNIGQIGSSAVSQYVIQKQAEAERQKNDPLVALQTQMDDSVALMKNQVTGLYSQLQDTLSAAPQLFGSLTPDQIQTYLAPLKTSFDAQLSQVQGVMASRGVSGSSTENNALAQTDKQFKEQVLSTGLQVGLDQQKSKAQSIQQQISNLFGLTSTEESIKGSAAERKSAQDLGQSNLIASLPYFLDQSAAMQSQIAKQQNSGGGFWDTFNKVTSGIKTGVDTFQTLMQVPAQFKSNAPAPSGGSSPNIPFPGSSMGTGEGSAAQGAELFAAPV